MTIDIRFWLHTPHRRDYRQFLVSQSISNLGSSFTLFGLPLLVYLLTGSAMNLAVTTVAGFLPYLLFGLVIGALVDGADRKRLMIGSDLLRGLVIGVIPLLNETGGLTVWWVYAVAFANTSLGIVSAAVESTAIPSLVPRAELPDANGKLRASYAIAQVIGPLMAGALVGGGLPLPWVFAVDAGSFGVAAVLMMRVRATFNAVRVGDRGSVLAAVRQGIRYVFGHPVLRNIALHAAAFNLIAATVTSQLVLFAHDRLGASNAQVSILFAAGALGTAVAVFGAGRLARRLSFKATTLGAILCWSGLVLCLSLSSQLWLAAVFWAAAAGLPSVYAVRTTTLRQSLVPDELLGRVQTVAQTLAWSAQPLGALAGAAIIASSGQISAVYAGIAVLVAITTLLFWLGPLNRVEASV
jgi:MFS family permease